MLKGSSGADTLYGGDGSDTFNFAHVGSGVSIDLAANKHTGFASATQILEVENVTGGSGDDTIRGTTGANTLTGGDGDDLLIGTSGAGDKFIGGDGTDIVSYQNATAGVEVDFAATSVNTGTAAGDTYSEVEGLTGSAHNDILRGNDSNNILRGEKGDDRIAGRGGNDFLYGGEGNDVLYGNIGSDRIYGDQGNDQLFGEEGDDYLRGNTGNDSLWGGAGADTFYFGTGSNRDIIADFDNNIDTIHLANSGVTSFAKAKTFAKQDGKDVIFDFGDGDVVIVRSTTIAQLEDDMIFG